MRVLWAPWRYAYIRRAVKGEMGGCPFCKIQEMSDEEGLIVYRGPTAMIVMNLYPYNTGHVMVMPKRHVREFRDLTPREKLEIMLLVEAAIEGLRESLNPHGFNIGVNLGRVAGAGIEDHLHIHIVPRWNGDTNFMPVIAETKVIPQDVRETYRQIRDPIRKHAERLLGEHRGLLERLEGP